MYQPKNCRRINTVRQNYPEKRSMPSYDSTHSPSLLKENLNLVVGNEENEEGSHESFLLSRSQRKTVAGNNQPHGSCRQDEYESGRGIQRLRRCGFRDQCFHEAA